MYKLLLIQPSQYSTNGKLVKQKRIYLPGLVFPLLASYVPDHWALEVRIEVVEEIDFDTDADIVGISAMGHSIFRAFELAKVFRSKGKKVFIGGYMASMVPDFALRNVDSVVVGDAEKSFPMLLRDFETTGTIKRIYDHPLNNFNSTLLPKYEILLNKPIGSMLPVQAGRGCPHSCSFCSIACVYKGKYLVRPVHEVIRDIKRIKELGFNRFYLIDDNIVSNPEYLEELCNEIKPLNMTWASQCTINLARNKRLLHIVANSGCKILSVGIESISQEGLNKLKKNWLRVTDHEKLINTLSKAGIMVSAEMIVGTDGDTLESLKATYNFIMRTRLPLVRLYILTPIIGTKMYEEFKQQGRLLHEDQRLYNAANCVHVPKKITPEDLTKTFWWLNKKLFSFKSILQRTILNKQFLSQPMYYYKAFLVNFHYRKSILRMDAPNML